MIVFIPRVSGDVLFFVLFIYEKMYYDYDIL